MGKPIVTIKEYYRDGFEEECAKLAEQGYRLAYTNCILLSCDGDDESFVWIAVMAKQVCAIKAVDEVEDDGGPGDALAKDCFYLSCPIRQDKPDPCKDDFDYCIPTDLAMLEADPCECGRDAVWECNGYVFCEDCYDNTDPTT